MRLPSSAGAAGAGRAVPTELLPPGPGGWWWCRVAGRDGRPARVSGMLTSAYPDGALVDLDEEAAAAAAPVDDPSTATFDAEGNVVHLFVSPRLAPKAPPLWFAEVRESAARPPAVNLVGFTGAGQRPGALLDEAAVSNVAVVSDDQVGAVRWTPSTGKVDQVYVQPQWRRRNVATVLLVAAEMLSVARGWPGMWGDGQRTLLGERLRAARAWQHRTADLTHLHPPMTPGDPWDGPREPVEWHGPAPS